MLAEEHEHLVGRDPSSAIALPDPRVSARHALLRCRSGAWTIADLGSKNGTIVNGVRLAGDGIDAAGAAEQPLEDEDWISFGGLLARFEMVSNDDLRALDVERSRRLQTSTEIRRDLDAAPDARAVLRRLLESAIGVVGAERGCVLVLRPDGNVHGEVAVGAAGSGAAERVFRGSLGAIERVLETGEPVVAADARSDAFLARRRSVAEMGIGALACVPLRSEGRVEGLLYVDGRARGGAFTELDLEILETLSDHASLVLASIDIDRRIRELGGPGNEIASERQPEFFRELAARVGAHARPAGGAGARAGV